MGYPIVFTKNAAVIVESGSVYAVHIDTGVTEFVGNTGLSDARDLHHYEGGRWYFLDRSAIYVWNESSGPLTPANVSLLFSVKIPDPQGLTYDYNLDRFVISSNNQLYYYTINGSPVNTVTDLDDDANEQFNSTGGITPYYPSNDGDSFETYYATGKSFGNITDSLVRISALTIPTNQAEEDSQFNVYKQTIQHTTNILPPNTSIHAITNYYRSIQDSHQLYVFWNRNNQDTFTAPPTNQYFSRVDINTGIASGSLALNPAIKDAVIRGATMISERPILGCTDPDANNYNPNATVDDGSCDFSSDDGGTDPVDPVDPVDTDPSDCKSLLILNTGWDFDKSRPMRNGQTDSKWMKVKYGSAANKNAGHNSHEYHSPYKNMDGFEDKTVDIMGGAVHRWHDETTYPEPYSTTDVAVPYINSNNIVFEPGGANPNPNIDRLKNINPFDNTGLGYHSWYDNRWYNYVHGQDGGSPSSPLSFPGNMDNFEPCEVKIIIQITEGTPEGSGQASKYRVGLRDTNGEDHFFTHETFNLHERICNTSVDLSTSHYNSLNGLFTVMGIVDPDHENAQYSGDFSVTSSKHTFGSTGSNSKFGHAIRPTFSSIDGHHTGDTWVISVTKGYLGGKNRPKSPGTSVGPGPFTHCSDNYDFYLSYPATRDYPFNIGTDSGGYNYTYLPEKRPTVSHIGRIRIQNTYLVYGYACGQYKGDSVTINSKNDVMRRLEDIYEDFEHEHSVIFRNAPAEFTLPEGGEAVLGVFTDWNGNAIQNDYGYFLPNMYTGAGMNYQFTHLDGIYRPFPNDFFMSGGKKNPAKDPLFHQTYGNYETRQINCPPGYKSDINRGRPDYYEATGQTSFLPHTPPGFGIKQDDNVHCAFPHSMVVGPLNSFLLGGQTSASHLTVNGGKAQMNDDPTLLRHKVRADGQYDLFPVIPNEIEAGTAVPGTNDVAGVERAIYGRSYRRKALDYERKFNIPEGATNVTAKLVFSSYDNVMLFLNKAGNVNLPVITTHQAPWYPDKYYYTCELSDNQSMDAVMIGSTCYMEGSGDYIVNPANLFKHPETNRVIGRNYPLYEDFAVDPYYDATNNTVLDHPTMWDTYQGEQNNTHTPSTHSLMYWSKGGFTNLAMADMQIAHWSACKNHRYEPIQNVSKIYGDPFRGGNRWRDFKANGFGHKTISGTIATKPISDILEGVGLGGIRQHKNFMAVEIDAGGKFKVFLDGYYKSNGDPKFVYYTGNITGWGDAGEYLLRARNTQTSYGPRNRWAGLPTAFYTNAFETAHMYLDSGNLFDTNMGAGFVVKGYVEYDCANVRGEITRIDGEPLFYSKQEALDRAKKLGCVGYHTHRYENVIGYMACQSHSVATK